MGLKRKTPLANKGKGLKRTPFLSKQKKPLKRTAGLSQKLKIADSEEGEAGRGGLVRTSGLSRGAKPLNRGTKMLSRGSSILRRGGSLARTAWKAVVKDSSTGLKRTTRFKMDMRLVREAKKFHDEVWAMFGERCVLCTKRHPAEAAAHVLKRSMLGKLRYADPRFARPAHHQCHVEQEENRLQFSLAIRQDAVRAYNKITKNVPLPEPVE